jgi:hypothetical protein
VCKTLKDLRDNNKFDVDMVSVHRDSFSIRLTKIILRKCLCVCMCVCMFFYYSASLPEQEELNKKTPREIKTAEKILCRN